LYILDFALWHTVTFLPGWRMLQYMVGQKKFLKLFLSELRQISTIFDNF